MKAQINNYLKILSIITSSFFVILIIFPLTSAQTLLKIDLDDKGTANLIENNKIIETTSNLTFKQGEIWSFSYSSLGNEIELALPKGSEILDVSADSILTEDNRIILFSKDKIEVKYKISQDSNQNNYLITLITLVFILIIIILYYYFIKQRKNKIDNINRKQFNKKSRKDKLSIIKKVLNEREKLILNQLKKTGKIKMSYLRKITDIPKASFSRHLMELERKQLVKRTGEGKNKLVEIK